MMLAFTIAKYSATVDKTASPFEVAALVPRRRKRWPGNVLLIGLGLTVALFAGSLTACRGKTEIGQVQAREVELTKLYQMVHNSPPACECFLWINGEPIDHTMGEVSSMRDITNFLVNGLNVVTYTARRANTAGLIDCSGHSLSIMRHSGFDDPSPVEVAAFPVEFADGKDQFEGRVEFRAQIPLAWEWQRAEQLRELSPADKRGIRGVLCELAARWRVQDFDRALAYMSQWVPEGMRVRYPGQQASDRERHWLMERGRRTLARVRDVHVKPLSEFRFIAGKRLVRVEARAARGGVHEGPEAYLLTADVVGAGTNKDPASVHSFGDKHYYCAKLDGRWRVFVAAWSQQD